MNDNFLLELNLLLENIILERQKALGGFNCVSSIKDNAFKLFNTAKELTDKEINVKEYIKNTFNKKFVNFILEKEILMYCLFWACLAKKNKSEVIYRFSIYTYCVFLYPFLFRKMLPYCDNLQLQTAVEILSKRKNTYISNVNSHMELLDFIIKERIKKYNFLKLEENQIYREFINITNLLRQIIRSIIDTYINKKLIVNASDYIDKENLFSLIYNSLVIIDISLLQKISTDRNIFYKTLEEKFTILQKEGENFLKLVEDKISNPVFLKRNNLKSVYWSDKFTTEILVNFSPFKKENINVLKAIAEYFRRYILNYI